MCLPGERSIRRPSASMSLTRHSGFMPQPTLASVASRKAWGAGIQCVGAARLAPLISRAEHDYRNSSPRRFRLAYNPAAGIRPSQRRSAPAGWMRMILCGCTAGSNAPTSRASSLPPRHPHPDVDGTARRGDCTTARRSVGCGRRNHRLVKDEEQPAARHTGPHRRRRADKFHKAQQVLVGPFRRRWTRPYRSATTPSTASSGGSGSEESSQLSPIGICGAPGKRSLAKLG